MFSPAYTKLDNFLFAIAVAAPVAVLAAMYMQGDYEVESHITGQAKAKTTSASSTRPESEPRTSI